MEVERWVGKRDGQPLLQAWHPVIGEPSEGHGLNKAGGGRGEAGGRE